MQLWVKQEKMVTENQKNLTLNMTEKVNESVNEYEYAVGDMVKDVNPTCPHNGAIGKVKSINPKSVVFVVVNKGKNYQPGDVLDKTHDQMIKMESIDEKIDFKKHIRNLKRLVNYHHI